jgi:hypothetical protein
MFKKDLQVHYIVDGMLISLCACYEYILNNVSGINGCKCNSWLKIFIFDVLLKLRSVIAS